MSARENGSTPSCTIAPVVYVKTVPGSAARSPSSGETVDSGTTVAEPPPWVRGRIALWPITATRAGATRS
ncbi:hypothetical protein GALL_403690 [mine drainage metagenome]|uniref:Uncharacterized protein n=1 Tax=mine drainage metagenome TaxID=410659 RepID=A0A1J5QD71_9ZZZZ